MENKNKRWTEQEDNLLAQNVIDNYDNLSIAFKKTAIELERSYNGCRLRWYEHTRKQNVCFASISEKKAIKNRKTLPKNYAKDYVEMSNKRSKLKELVNKIKSLFS